MPPPLQQRKDLVKDDRQNVSRALERAIADTTRKPERNRKIIFHLKEATRLYLEDMTDGTGKTKRAGAAP